MKSEMCIDSLSLWLFEGQAIISSFSSMKKDEIYKPGR